MGPRIRIKIRVTLPREITNLRTVQLAIAYKQQDKTIPDLVGLFARTVEGWNNPPDWDTKQTTSASRISARVWASGPNANQYAMVSAGTRPHPIYPRMRGGFLRFQAGYAPSTKPGSLISGPSHRFGPSLEVRSVEHPGIVPRDFDIQIADMYGETFYQDMQDAIGLGVVGRTWSTPGY